MNKEILEEDIEGSKAELARFNLESLVFDVNITESFYKKEISNHISNIISELTSNCAEKGAKKITVTLKDNSLKVEDDFIETDPEESIKLLNHILTSGKGEHTTKEEMRRLSNYYENGLGGVGISSVVLPPIKAANGTLKFLLTPDNRIVAEAFWE